MLDEKLVELLNDQVNKKNFIPLICIYQWRIITMKKV